MFNKLLTLIFISLSLFIISCESSEENQKTCKDNETLINEECKLKSLLCGQLICNETQECIDNKCATKELPSCGELICTEGQECIDNKCITKEVPSCENIVCETNQECINNQCVNKDNCKNIICENNEICEANICKKSLIFATYNLYDLKKVNAYENLAKFISESNIGIIVSQEIQVEDKEPLMEEFSKLGLDVNIEFSSYGGYGGDDGDDYLAVISRWPIKEVNTVLVGYYEDPITNNSYSYTYMRPVHEIIVDVFGEELTIFNIHLKAQSPWATCTDCIEKRRAQAHALENYINDFYYPETDKIIIAGDANTATQNDEDFAQGNTLDILSLKSDNPEYTENDFLPINFTYKKETTHTAYQSLMDHIILSPELLKNYREGSVDVVTPEGSPSDHKAVLLILDF